MPYYLFTRQSRFTLYVTEYLSTCDRLLFNTPVSTLFGPSHAICHCGTLTLWPFLCCSPYRKRHSTFGRRDEELGTASRSWHHHPEPSAGSVGHLAHIR